MQLQSTQEKSWEFYSAEIKLCESAYASPQIFQNSESQETHFALKMTREIL